MSSIGFHSPGASVSIHGPEYAHARGICFDLLVDALMIRSELDYPGHASPLRMVMPSLYARELGAEWYDDTRNFVRDFENYVRAPRAALVFPNGCGSDSCFHLALNAAIVAGSDPVRFLARVAGQCERHGYVEGPNRAWLAGIVEEGLACNLLRRVFDGSQYADREDDWWGWSRLVQLLRASDSEPVVMSYSVENSFPSCAVLAEAGEPLSDEAWDALSLEDQWERAMAALRKLNQQANRELSPESLAVAGFGRGVSGYDLRAQVDEEIMRMRKVQEWQ